MFGRMYHEGVAKFAWTFLFFGFNLAFLPQFVLGMEGMPRRYYDYPPEWEGLHQLSTIGAFLNGVGYALVLGNLFISYFNGKRVGENPWNALSLEWQTPSPPAHANFEQIPQVEDWFYAYDVEVEEPSNTNGTHIRGETSEVSDANQRGSGASSDA